jgi:hypothetical protein
MQRTARRDRNPVGPYRLSIAEKMVMSTGCCPVGGIKDAGAVSCETGVPPENKLIN